MATLLVETPALNETAALDIRSCGICKKSHGVTDDLCAKMKACQHSFHKACLIEIRILAISDDVCPECSIDEPVVQLCAIRAFASKLTVER